MIEYRVAYKTFINQGYDRFVTQVAHRPLDKDAAEDIARGMNMTGAGQESQKLYGPFAIVQTREVSDWR